MRPKTEYFFILILSLLTAVLFYSNRKLINKADLYYEANSKLQRVADSLALYQLKSEADNRFIEGDYTNSLAVYEELDARNFFDYKIKDNRKIQQTFEDKEKEALRQQADTLQLLVNRLRDFSKKQINTTDNLAWDVFALSSKVDSLLTNRTIYSDSLRANYGGSGTPLRTLNIANANGTIIHYYGQVFNNKAEGQGSARWPSGDVYFGNWSDNKRNGIGTFIWSNGNQYEGEFVDDQRHGEGTYAETNGQTYEGNWANNKKNGYGKITNRSGRVVLEGEFKDDNFVYSYSNW